jgi:hypothetical protein
VAAYKLDVASFDSVSLQTSDYEAWFKPGDGIIDTFPAQNVDVQIPDSWPQRVGVQYAGKAFPVHVRLLDTTSTKLLALQKLFRAGQGVKILRCTDGAGTTLRLNCESLGLLSTDNPVEFVARLWATKPVWEKDTETTDAHLACSGDSHDFTLTNNGSAPAKPKFTLKANAAKKGAGGPPFFCYRNFFNQCVNALSDPDGEGWPTLLKSSWDTATLVKNTAISNQINQTGGIAAGDTTIPIDTAVGGGLPTGPGMAMIETEQVYYPANSGSSLTGCIRGIGGTTAAAHADNVVLYASKALANGNDLRVWVDGAEVDRWFGTGSTAWKQATTKLWANVPWRAKKATTILSAMTASVPADAGSFDVVGDISNWPDAGFLFVASGSFEVIYYAGHTSSAFTGIKRGQKGTTAGTHAAGSVVALVEHDIRYTYGDAGAGSPPSDADLKPMIDLALSTNTLWCWPAAYRAEGTRRSAQWQQGYENVNTLCPKLRAFEASSKMQVEDAAPEAGKLNRNTWSISLPAGIAGANAIHHDVLVPANMLLQVYGDDGAALNLLQEYNPDNDGDGKNITPATTLYALQYWGLVRTVTASEGAATYVHDLSDSGHAVAQRFTLDQETAIWGFSVRLAKTAGADGNIRAQIRSATGSDLDAYELFWDQVLCAAIDLSTDFAEITEWFTAPVVLPAGSTYYLVLYREGGSAAAVRWAYTFPGPYAKGEIHCDSGTAWTTESGNDAWFRILGDGSVCQPEVPSATGEEVTVDDIELILNSSGVPAATTTGEQACYLWEAVLTNATSGQSLTLLVPAEVGQELEIDCLAQTVINKTTGESVAFGLAASDPAGWIDVLPGANSLTYAEVGMTDTDLTAVFRDTYAA